MAETRTNRTFKEVSVGSCHDQTGSDRFGPGIRVLVVAREHIAYSYSTFDTFPVDIYDLHEATPKMQFHRNNLTALSQCYNLYFAAYGDIIYVYRPRNVHQVLPSKPELMIHLPVMKNSTAGYQDAEHPRYANHMIVGQFGLDEILVVASDNGDVSAFYTKPIADRVCHPDNPAYADYVQFVLSECVYSSAWGLAVHAKSRLVAVSSNAHQVTVFAPALNLGKHAMDEQMASCASSEEKAVRRRDRYWRIVISMPKRASNMPNISFINDDQGLAQKVCAMDIHGQVWMADIWTIGTPVLRLKRDLRCSVCGWGVLALRDEDFLEVGTFNDMVGGPLSRVDWSRRPRDITPMLRHVRGMPAHLFDHARHIVDQPVSTYPWLGVNDWLNLETVIVTSAETVDPTSEDDDDDVETSASDHAITEPGEAIETIEEPMATGDGSMITGTDANNMGMTGGGDMTDQAETDLLQALDTGSDASVWSEIEELQQDDGGGIINDNDDDDSDEDEDEDETPNLDIEYGAVGTLGTLGADTPEAVVGAALVSLRRVRVSDLRTGLRSAAVFIPDVGEMYRAPNNHPAALRRLLALLSWLRQAPAPPTGAPPMQTSLRRFPASVDAPDEARVPRYHLLTTYSENIEMMSLSSPEPAVLLRDAVFAKLKDNSSTPQPSQAFRIGRRLSMVTHVASLCLVVVGSALGRVVLLTPTRRKKPIPTTTLSATPLPKEHVTEYGFRVEAVLPRDIDHDKKPAASPLWGLAVGPVQHQQPADSLELGGNRCEFPRRYRLMLHYRNFTVLSYDLRRSSVTGDVEIF